MDVSEYGCNEDHNVKDDDSIVSERCWKERHRGDSRKWILRDGSTTPSDRQLKSTMRATYPYPFHEEREYLGQRKAAIMQKLYNEAAEEIIRERQEPPPIEEYCTEYDGNYNSNIKVVKPFNEEEIKQNLYEKYPLYTSPAMSYWNFKIEKSQRVNASFVGLTTSVDRKNPFKRYSGFTKPISEALEENK